ncbi:TetR family transcriptional regulator [Streptomyces sp. NPDC002054]|uniref:TetR family transcriptional regulator n=1 Tax=Streptomyces sp. NPDC002054 TaxID=3154663 RepID=UPI00332547F2
MARQDRAELTRQALIAAASAEFDRHGYAATSLSRVSRAAGVSMGALTFHFTTKDALAAAVTECGSAATRAGLRHLHGTPMPALQAVIDLTHTLAALLEEDTAVRAAARLARDHADPALDWNSAWLPTLRELLTGSTGLDAQRIEVFVLLLMTGIEAALHGSPQIHELAGHNLREQLTQAWQVVLHATPGPPAPPGEDPAPTPSGTF